MQLENSFELEVAPEEAWNVLLDVPRIVPCIPGAELVEVRGETEWLVRVKVKLGSMGMDFLNEVKLAERDDAAHMIRLDLKGRGRVGAWNGYGHRVIDRSGSRSTNNGVDDDQPADRRQDGSVRAGHRR